MAINWYTALLINERLEAIKTHKFSIDIDETAREKYAAHQNLYAPFFDDFMSEKKRFEWREAESNGQNIEKTYVAYEPPTLSHQPDWVKCLTEAYTTFDNTHPNRVRFQHSNETTLAFWSFFEPLLSVYAQKMGEALDKLITQYGFSFFNKKDLTPFLEPAVEKMAAMAARAFILELRVAKQSDELQGDTSTARFQHFFEALKQPTAALTFFEIYPVLGRIASKISEDWAAYFIEIISHLYADLAELKEKIPPLPIVSGCAISKIHTLTHINALLTDGAQTGGRTVAILTFNDDLKVVYKPRDSAIDVAYGQFMAWFNAENVVPPTRYAEIVSRPTYSWYEFVAPQGDMTHEELPVMYTKLGSLLCLMYLFDTVDMHTANLIVVGDDPILIDLETWLQPSLCDENRQRSVRQTHLLPDIKHFMPDDVDLEGLTESEVSDKIWTERKELVWENEGTDEMRIVRKRLPYDKNNNRIHIADEAINPADYTLHLVKGFRKTYRHIAAHKTAFLEAVGCFSHKKLRTILRGAKKYDALVEDMTHPSNLQDGNTLDQFLDRLWITAADEPYLKALIGIEKSDLINANNPYFYTYSDSKTLYYNNKPLVNDFFDKSALDIVQQNIDALSTTDLEKQVRIIRRSFAKLKLYYAETTPSV